MASPAATVTTTLAIPLDQLSITAAPPDTLSQVNVEAVTGVPASIYLDRVRAPGLPFTVAKVGKLRIVERAAFVRWLLAQDETRAESPANDAANVDPVDALAAEMGLRPVATSARRAR